MRLAGMRWRAGGWAAVFILLLVARVLYGSEDLRLALAPRVDVACEVPFSAYRVDQVIPFKIVIRSYDRAAEPSYETPSLPLDNLAVVETSQSVETRIESGTQMKEIVLLFKLKPLKPGRACVGSFGFAYKTSETGMIEHTQIEPHCFEIREKPWMAQISRRAFMAAGGGLGTLLLGGFFGVSFLKRKQSRVLEAPVSLEDQSLKELDRLTRDTLVQDSRDFLTQSDDILRRYLARRYDAVSSRMGGLELLEWIERRRDVDSDDKKKIRGILEAITECRFGGSSPRQEEAVRIRQKVRDFIAAKRMTVNDPLGH